MAIPNVSVTVNTTGIAVVPPNTGNVPLLLGTSAGGTYGQLTTVAGTPQNVQSALGNGPLADKAALDLATGAPVVQAWRMFSGSMPGTFTAGEGNTGTGVVTVSGTAYPVAPFGTPTGTGSTGPIVSITVSSGVSTPGQFSISLDGGITYSASQTIPSGLTYVIPNTGITIHFSAQEGSGVWVSGDSYTDAITSFLGSMAGIGQSGFTLLQVGPTGTVAGAVGEGTFTSGTGTNPIDDFQVVMKIVTTGAIGAAQYVVSFDGGITFSPVTTLASSPVSLGQGIILNAANTGGQGATSGFVAGDVYSFQTTGPRFTPQDVTNVLGILTANPAQFGWVHVLGKSTSISVMTNMNGNIQTALLDWWESDRFSDLAFMDAPPNSAQSNINAALIAAAPSMTGAVGVTQANVAVGAGDLALVSPITGFQMNRCASWAASARACSAPLGQDLADVGAGALVGVTQLYYNEATAGGPLDAVGYTTARTINGISGFYLTNCNILAPEGSDIFLAQYARVLNQAAYLGYAALVLYLNSSVRVLAGGTIDPRDANAIQNNVTTKILAGLAGQVTSVSVLVDTAHNILTDGELPVDVGVTPLGYAKQIAATLGFTNSALSALAA